MMIEMTDLATFWHETPKPMILSRSWSVFEITDPTEVLVITEIPTSLGEYLRVMILPRSWTDKPDRCTYHVLGWTLDISCPGNIIA